jgi:acetyltransferase-like isoleucine patch superfamily enzyme
LANFEKHIVPQITRPIEIGHNCWICYSSSISGGAKIPDFTIVASHSLVGKDFSDLNNGSLIGGIPAKLIANNIYRIWNKKMTNNIYKFFQENSETVFHLGEDTCFDDIL